jgi:hypothetical protein
MTAETSEEVEYTSARTYVLPSNGWDISYPDGRVPGFVQTALNRAVSSWKWHGSHFELVLANGETVVWKRGETLFIADGTRILKHLDNEVFWGMEMRDRGFL